MTRPPVRGLLAALLLGVGACGVPSGNAATQQDVEADVLARRERRTAAALALTDSGAPSPAPVARWVLPHELDEISGLALTADERLLAHDDQHGRVVEIDYRRGTIVKQFHLGPKVVQADFEGITVAGDALFLLASDGRLFRFAEGRDGEHVPYTIHETGLAGECEFEGVAYDPAIESLLLACKSVMAPELRDSLLIYRWKLGDGLSPAARLSRLAVPVASIIGSRDWKSVHPSDIAVDPKSGHYVMVASKDQALIEITAAGVVVAVRQLPGTHAQAEGIAITRDHGLIISDEAAGRQAVITVYRLP